MEARDGIILDLRERGAREEREVAEMEREAEEFYGRAEEMEEEREGEREKEREKEKEKEREKEKEAAEAPPPLPVPSLPSVQVDPASVPAFDTSSCAIGWQSYVSPALTSYFFPTSSSSPALPSTPPPPSSCVEHGELLAVRCYIKDLTVTPSLITAAYGGEPLATVMGQAEDVEYAKYEVGAFSAEERDLLPKAHMSHAWYINKVLAAMTATDGGASTGGASTDGASTNVGSSSCSPTPTLFITRYEYVNLFHTMTDWWNVFEAVPQEFWTENNKLDIVWLDGHAQGNLDPVWSTAFGQVTPVKHLKGPTCYSRAIVVSAGYASPLWFNNRSWRSPPCPARADAFRHHMLARFGLSGAKRVPKRVVLIDRVPYTAHPRSAPGKMPRTISNIEDLSGAVEAAGGEVKVVRFEELSFGEQLREVAEADILVGIHGAGLSHVLFMSEGSTMVELATNTLGMFSGFASWRPDVAFVSVAMGSGQRNYELRDKHIGEVVKILEKK